MGLSKRSNWGHGNSVEHDKYSDALILKDIHGRTTKIPSQEILNTGSEREAERLIRMVFDGWEYEEKYRQSGKESDRRTAYEAHMKMKMEVEKQRLLAMQAQAHYTSTQMQNHLYSGLQQAQTLGGAGGGLTGTVPGPYIDTPPITDEIGKPWAVPKGTDMICEGCGEVFALNEGVHYCGMEPPDVDIHEEETQAEETARAYRQRKARAYKQRNLGFRNP
jgi:hypothetical protein